MAKIKKLRVFLCHASVDKPRAIRLYYYLLEHGVQPWISAKNILPGQEWEDEITEAINASDVILVILSKDSIIKEGYVQKEIRQALEKSKEKPPGKIFLIPLKLEACELPKKIWGNIQWVNIFEKEGKQLLMKALKKRAEQLGRSPVGLPKESEASPDFSKGKNNAPETDADKWIRLFVEKDILKVQVSDYEFQIRLLTKERDNLKKQGSGYELQIDQLTGSNKTLQDERDKLKEKLKEATLDTPKYHGCSFIDMRDKLENTIAKSIPMLEENKNSDDFDKKIIRQYLAKPAEPPLLLFYWMFSRLIDYGISKDDINEMPEIYSNLKSLIDFGLVEQEKRERQTFLVHTESGKNFLLQLRMTGEPLVKDKPILG